ncbi:MAG TPA: hypothetical protein DC054_16295 [Blastocatellia bacterium]|nr:hypothetical protein [Blastocatellia bacterium]
MRTKIISAGVLVAVLCILWAGGNKGATAVSTQQSNPSQSASGDLHFKAPNGWTTEQTSSPMRVAQYKLPKVEGDKEDASLVLYYFGATQGGTSQANIDRWISQMQQPDGSSSKDKAKTETITVNGLKVATVDVTGTYTAEMAPGSKTFHNDENYRLRAAVVETPKGNYFVKLSGPAKTIARWDQSYTDYLKSFEFK